MDALLNQYFACRHGESRANVEGIIVSDPAVGTVRYGLTEKGRRQVNESITCVEQLDETTVIVSSDFRRAAETAEIIREALGAGPVVFDERLRERFFGDWEGRSHRHYSEAWQNDIYDPEKVLNGAESTQSVRQRMLSVIKSMEKGYSGRNIVLVSHGDPLMLLLTAFEGVETARHRSLPYFSTAEIRRLN